jgi:uncharacterized protein
MKRVVFVDSFYWIALYNRRDQFHHQVKANHHCLRSVLLVTTEEVLIEVLASFSNKGAHMRKVAAQTVRELMNDPNIQVLPQTHGSFMDGLDLYERRSDKEYSLTDCISMAAMRALKINDVLTDDHHFTQEGFSASPIATRT